MINETLQCNKDLGHTDPITESIGQILKVSLTSGASFAAKLIGVRGASLLFERRDGLRTLVHRDTIAFATEVVPRGRP